MNTKRYTAYLPYMHLYALYGFLLAFLITCVFFIYNFFIYNLQLIKRYSLRFRQAQSAFRLSLYPIFNRQSKKLSIIHSPNLSLYVSKKKYLLLFFCLSFFISKSQDSISTPPINYKSRKLILSIGSSALTTGSLIYLHQAWYKNYNTGSFHFFDDNNEWYAIDKCGHTLTTYQTARLMMGAFDWAGFKPKQQLWIGGTMGFAYMSAVEVMDGYSRGWGFSWGDMGANALGSAFAISQQAVWKEQRIQLKFSYFPSDLAQYNPRLLGSSEHEKILKDYNAQTYWLSVNPYSFLNKQSRFPKWLNVALGYGGQDMIGAVSNPTLYRNDGSVINFNRRQQYYLSLDIQLSNIKTRSAFLKRLLSVVSIIKIPSPTLELSNGKLIGHFIYF